MHSECLNMFLVVEYIAYEIENRGQILIETLNWRLRDQQYWNKETILSCVENSRIFNFVDLPLKGWNVIRIVSFDALKHTGQGQLQTIQRSHRHSDENFLFFRQKEKKVTEKNFMSNCYCFEFSPELLTCIAEVKWWVGKKEISEWRFEP